MNKEFRKWYTEKDGTKWESFAYDVWCASWEAATWEATKPQTCICENPQRCNTFDRCTKNG
jgi:hypothetical protein